MTKGAGYATTISTEEHEVQILSSEKLEDVVQELTSLRGATDGEFDSESIDNAIRLCEKIDICFENLDEAEKQLIIQNYEFFSSGYQFTLFLKLMFHGGMETKENIFRALAHKLRATNEVIQCVLSTKVLFESQEIEEDVRFRLQNFIDSLSNGYMSMIPRSVRGASKDSLTVSNLLKILAKQDNFFNESKVSYSEITQQFTDLLYTIFSHEQLPFYFKWKDQYLKHWLVSVLREEDRAAKAATPELSAAKAELYVEYINWTKIARRLNANLRHLQTFNTETTIRAEKVLLERLPSNILLELVLKIRRQMTEGKELPKVDLGVAESSLDEAALYDEILDEIVEAETKDGRKSSWLGLIVGKVKEIFHPTAKEPELEIAFIDRVYPEGLLSTVNTDCMRFGQVFPKDYPSSVPKQFSLFLTRSRTNFFPAFEETILEILMRYEENDFSCIENTPFQLTMSDNNRGLEFEEHCLAIPVEGKYLLVLGNSYFEMSFKDYNIHPAPYAYFQWYEKISKNHSGDGFRNFDSLTYKEIPLKQIGSHKAAFQGLIRVIDSLPDESREKRHIQQMLHFLHEK
ncbi:MAG: hypothetical protein HQM14_04990 [SAR324 cluster bacterium]|nr:hypothetical protein [SAR324 cluster bacterium]